MYRAFPVVAVADRQEAKHCIRIQLHWNWEEETKSDNTMIACFDVGYSEDTAGTRALSACLTFDAWDAAVASEEYQLKIETVQEYVPGEFYRRELPCILAVIEKLPRLPDCFVIDGYVWLAPGKMGLGGHLYDAFDHRIPVIGIAKTRFATASDAHEVFRGKSERPLFITSIGMEQVEAASHVERMHGAHRIPTLLKRVDALSRQS